MNVLGNNSCTGCAAIKAIEGGMLFRVFDFNYACKANPASYIVIGRDFSAHYPGTEIQISAGLSL